MQNVNLNPHEMVNFHKYTIMYTHKNIYDLIQEMAFDHCIAIGD